MSFTARRGSSISTKEENMSYNVHFKWDSIKKFIYIGFAFSIATNMSNLFVLDGVRIFDYMLLQLTVGMSYLCMDFFIKQYTRKIDFMSYLNPLLRGVTYGSILQSSMLALQSSSDLSDLVRYLIASFGRPPAWSLCPNTYHGPCITIEDIDALCAEKKTNITEASAHIYYQVSFENIDRATATSRTFISAVVWVANFFCSTLNDAILVKMMRISFYWSTLSSFMLIIFLAMHFPEHKYTALIGILNITAPTTFVKALDQVTQTYAIGLIGIHDYGSMSPYTMIDNTVVIYTILHTMYAFQRALINRILILEMSECVELSSFDSHYLVFVITPMSMHFLPLENFHIINFFITMFIQSATNVAMLTVTISRMIHGEFHAIRSVYIVGLVCACGFLSSLPMALAVLTFDVYIGMMHGLSTSSLFLGSYKVALIMYIYGVKNFTTDVHFWLGYKPTKYWTLNWMIMPVILFICFIKKFLSVYNMSNAQRYAGFSWIGITLAIVGFLNMKMVIKYLQRNNVMGLFKAHPKYGPLDRDILKKRKVYNETLKHKVCKHHCIVYDESYSECFHELVLKEDSDLINASSSVLSISHEKSPLKRLFSRSFSGGR